MKSIFSTRLRRFLLACAVALIAVTAFQVTILAVKTSYGDEAVTESVIWQTLGMLIGIPGLLGALFLWGAMWYHWASEKARHSVSWSVTWFLVLLLAHVYAALFYFVWYVFDEGFDQTTVATTNRLN